jgi:hypothetical protein
MNMLKTLPLQVLMDPLECPINFVNGPPSRGNIHQATQRSDKPQLLQLASAVFVV